jgi:hypothetical protein
VKFYRLTAQQEADRIVEQRGGVCTASFDAKFGENFAGFGLYELYTREEPWR